MNLTSAFELGVGYHGACWIDLSNNRIVIDRPIPEALDAFIQEVAHLVEERDDNQRIGVAYVRVIDGALPENYMAWHTDNADGSVRFHAAISTDGAPVALAFLDRGQPWLGRVVVDTRWRDAYQPGNGEVVAFTTETHGVLPQPVREGELTAVFFATLYESQEEADLYTTNNTQTGSHAMLPALEGER